MQRTGSNEECFEALEVVRSKVAEEDGEVLADRDAVPLLRGRGLSRQRARDALREQDGILWVIEPLRGRRGRPLALRPIEPVNKKVTGGNRVTAEKKVFGFSANCKHRRQHKPQITAPRKPYSPPTLATFSRSLLSWDNKLLPQLSNADDVAEGEPQDLPPEPDRIIRASRYGCLTFGALREQISIGWGWSSDEAKAEIKDYIEVGLIRFDALFGERALVAIDQPKRVPDEADQSGGLVPNNGRTGN